MNKLYQRNSNGSIQEWQIFFEGDSYFTVSGKLGSDKLVTSAKTQCYGKNLGKANETSAKEQCLLEVASKHKKKLESGYSETLEGIDSTGLLEPQLAKEYKDHFHKMKFPVIESAKLDGCLTGDTLLQTTKGQFTIKDIVDKELALNVKSYNEETGEVEYKRIVNFYNNGKTQKSSEWRELVIGNTVLTLTPNHKVFTHNGWKEAEQLNPESDLVWSTKEALKNQYISGLVLGDFCLSLDKRDCRINNQSWRVSGSSCNKEFVDSLGLLLGVNIRYSGKSGYGSDRWSFHDTVTKSAFPIDKFYETNPESEYLGKRKVISSYNINRYCTNASIALWFYCDGSTTKNNGNYWTPILQLSVHRYTDEQVEEFRKFFKKRYFAEPSVIIDKRLRSDVQSGATLKFETRDALYLLNIFRFFGIKGMEYKNYFPVESYMEPFEDGFHKFKLNKVATNLFIESKYDIEVEDNHSYFANNILVHNCRVNAVESGLYSRNGKPFVAIPHIHKALKPFFEKYPEYVLDGEIYNSLLRTDFNKIISLVRKTKPTQEDLAESEKLTQFWVFDIFRKDGKEVLNSFERKQLVKEIVSLVNNECVVALEFKVCNFQEELDKAYAEHLEEGTEGQMINAYGAVYKHSRCDTLLKRKEFQDAEFKIIDIISGKGNREGCAILVLESVTGKSFQCALKGDLEYMKKVFAEKEKYFDKLATVKFQNYTPANETGNDMIPRFPVAISLDRSYE